MKCYTVVQVAQVFDPVWGPAHHRALAFSSSAFLSAFFLNFNTCHLALSVLPVHSPPSSTNLCFLCTSPLGPIYYSKKVFSALHLVSHFLFIIIIIIIIILSLLSQQLLLIAMFSMSGLYFNLRQRNVLILLTTNFFFHPLLFSFSHPLLFPFLIFIV